VLGSNTGSTIATTSNNVIISDGAGNIRLSSDNTGLVTITGGVSTVSIVGLTTALTIDQGGTSHTTAEAAFNALAPTQDSNIGKVLGTNGITTSWVTPTTSAIVSGTVIGTGSGKVDLVFGSTTVQSSGSVVTTSTTATILDSLPLSVRTGKYAIQAIDSSTGHVHFVECVVIHDISNTVYKTEYGVTYSGAPLFTITATYNGTTAIDVKVTSVSTNTTQFKFNLLTFVG
jgi:hypothetical protein